MVTFHNRIPRPSAPVYSFTCGRIDFSMILGQGLRATVQLLVFRPGTTSGERAKVAFYSWLVTREMWMLVGPAVIGVAFLLLPVDDVWLRVNAGLIVTAGLAAVAWLLARPTLAAAHGIRVDVRRTKHGWEIIGDSQLFEEYADRLKALESAEVSPVEQEAEWARIYDDLAAIGQTDRTQ